MSSTTQTGDVACQDLKLSSLEFAKKTAGWAKEKAWVEKTGLIASKYKNKDEIKKIVPKEKIQSACLKPTSSNMVWGN